MTSQHKGAGAIQSEDCLKLLERAAASPQLRRAARSREFLFYVAGKSLKDSSTDIHEQEIGCAVFGRDENYDTSQDNIVRVSATELRKRIDGYFATDGASEPLIFEIPRGSYSPVFRWRSETIPPVAKPEAAEVPELPQPKASLPLRRQLPLMLVSAVAIVLAIGCSFLWQEDQSLINQSASMRKELHTWQGSPALTTFWGKFFDSPQETDIVLADTSYNLIEDISQQTYSLSEYLDRRYIDLSKPPAGLTRTVFEEIGSRRSSSFGDFRVAQKIKDLDRGSSKMQIDFARDYTTDSVKTNNVILIGGRRSNPWIDLFKDQLNFVLGYDQVLSKRYVKNLHPRPGEEAIYLRPLDQLNSIGYSVVAYLPNADHTANVLLIEGSDSQATNAAGDFVTSETSMANFLKLLNVKQFPYFEVLLKTTRLSGTPMSADVLAYRTY